MKATRRVSLLLVILMIFACASALAEFDLSVFDDVFYSVYPDDMTDKVWIEPSKDVDFGLLQGGDLILFNPSIIRTDDGDHTLRIECVFYTDRAADIQAVIIKIDDARYTIQETFQSQAADDKYIEKGMIVLGGTGLEMLNAMRGAKEVKVRYVGNERDVDFMLSQKAIDGFVKFHDDFLKAGGYEKETAEELERLCPITKK